MIDLVSISLCGRWADMSIKCHVLIPKSVDSEKKDGRVNQVSHFNNPDIINPEKKT